jgi:hypothetical protein
MSYMRGNETYRKEPASHYDSEYQVGVEHGVRKETLDATNTRRRRTQTADSDGVLAFNLHTEYIIYIISHPPFVFSH